jgi:DNA-directed RNA polymerase specialized sigma24 family protein
MSNGRSPRFATTRWSLVLQAKDRLAPDANEALADLCRAYWYPLYVLIRRRSRDGHEAQDLTQSFFARLLEKDFLGDVDPARGRFRAFLLAAVKHFLANEWDKDHAQKRGGGCRVVSLDARSFDWDSGESRYLLEPVEYLTAERVFERQWALALLDRVLSRLRDEQIDADKLSAFEVLQPFLSIDREAANYAQAAGQLGTTESAARVAAHRLRKRYRELLRDEIAHTVAGPEEIEDEIRYLFQALRVPVRCDGLD